MLRVVGEDHDPRQFTTWTAMVVAAIGELPAHWQAARFASAWSAAGRRAYRAAAQAR